VKHQLALTHVMSFAPTQFDFSKEGDIMSTTRKILTAVLLVFSFCFVSMYVIAPAQAATNSTSDDPSVILGPAPTTTPLATAPTVKRAHKPGYIRACEPTRANGGRKTILEYGKRSLPNPDGRKTIRAGHCRLIAVHRHRIFWISYDKLGRVTGSGYVRHIHLYIR
jgi:hypothetical protein